MNNNTRISYWDNIKFFLIFLVVLGHVFYFSTDTRIQNLMSLIYIFHMPAFAFISGTFGRHPDIRKTLKLGIYYIIFNSLLILTCDKSILVPAYSYWYLLSLIVWRIVTPYIPKKPIFVIIIAVTANLTIGFLKDVDNTLALSRTIAFFIYYYLGYHFNLSSNLDLESIIHNTTHTDENKTKIKMSISSILLIITPLLLAMTLSNILIHTFKINSETLQFLSLNITEDSTAIDVIMTRFMLILSAVSFILFILLTTPRNKIPIITTVGKNSLWIFLFQRPATLIVDTLLPEVKNSIFYGIVVSLFICLLFGTDYTTDLLKKLKPKVLYIAACISVSILFINRGTVPTGYSIGTTNPASVNAPVDPLYRLITAQQQEQFKDAFRITFAGDLILLEDQVKRGYRQENSSYDFKDMFKYTKEHISTADLAIGVFEGPTAGADVGYTTGNFDYGK